MQTHRAVRIPLHAFALLLLGCGGSTPATAPSETTPTTATPTASACSSTSVETVRRDVTFERSAAGSCPWGVGDNRPARNAVASARVEQVHELGEAPAGQLCSVSFDFGAEGTRFEYDDNFILLYGDVVMAASDGSLINRLPTAGNLRVWDWEAVAYQPMSLGCQPMPACPPEGPTVPYCLGGCSMNLIETGDRREVLIPQLNFDPALVAEIAARNGPQTLRFITLGDDELRMDCLHEAVSFQLVRTYSSAEQR